MDLQKMAEKLGLPGQDPSLMIGEGIGFVTNLLLYIYIYIYITCLLHSASTLKMIMSNSAETIGKD